MAVKPWLPWPSQRIPTTAASLTLNLLDGRGFNHLSVEEEQNDGSKPVSKPSPRCTNVITDWAMLWRHSMLAQA